MSSDRPTIPREGAVTLPARPESLPINPRETALIHVSGVVAGKPKRAIEDDDRILVDSSDILDSRGQVAALLEAGCQAPISYESFSPKIRALPVPELKKALLASVNYLIG